MKERIFSCMYVFADGTHIPPWDLPLLIKTLDKPSLSGTQSPQDPRVLMRWWTTQMSRSLFCNPSSRSQTTDTFISTVIEPACAFLTIYHKCGRLLLSCKCSLMEQLACCQANTDDLAFLPKEFVSFQCTHILCPYTYICKLYICHSGQTRNKLVTPTEIMCVSESLWNVIFICLVTKKKNV